ncbi:MAG: TIGR04290 family methyltransferase [Actinobacteria bacterium]|nr:TIGR04290 family methyltransferase [Actinomycetota bacterium]MCA1721964.1 TIGR04290 family methyltransferase [Actinomycetota bacterium]
MSLQTTAAGLPDEVAALGPWFHNLQLPGGVQTAPEHPLGNFPAYKWNEIADSLPQDLTGQRALDIGCNAGYYTFELAKRGADVLGIDHDPHFLTQARWASEQLGLADQVELRQLDVYDLARLDEQFDVVIFMGVLYHLRYPLLALDLVAEKVRGTLVLQTLTRPESGTRDIPDDLPFDERHELADPTWPSMAFIEHRLADDPTNWWAASPSAVEAMVRSAGLRVVGQPGYEIWLCERDSDSAHRGELDRATGRAQG